MNIRDKDQLSKPLGKHYGNSEYLIARPLKSNITMLSLKWVDSSHVHGLGTKIAQIFLAPPYLCMPCAPGNFLPPPPL